MHTLFAREAGAGPVILFLHGFCETSEIWDGMTNPLFVHYKVIALDLPGFGNSALPIAPFSISQIAGLIAEWIRTRNFPPVMVVGHSLGGYVALALAKDHPNLLAGLGLIHSSIFADSEEKKANRNKTIGFVERHGVEPFIETFVAGLFADKADPSIPFVHRIAMTTGKDTLLAYTAAMRDRPDQSAIWDSTVLPRLLISGRKDSVIPVESSRQMAANGGKLAYCELPEAAHMGFLEAKEECLTAISGFASPMLQNPHFYLR